MRLDYPVDRKHSRVPVLFDQRKRDKSPQCSRETVRLTLANVSMDDTRHDLPEVVRAEVKILGQFPIGAGLEEFLRNDIWHQE